MLVLTQVFLPASIWPRLEPGNSSGWWRTVQSLMGGRKDSTTALEPLATSICVENMGTLANKINAFFQSVAAHLPPLTEDSPFLTAECDVPDKYIISVDEVENNLHVLIPGKRQGPTRSPPGCSETSHPSCLDRCAPYSIALLGRASCLTCGRLLT